MIKWGKIPWYQTFPSNVLSLLLPCLFYNCSPNLSELIQSVTLNKSSSILKILNSIKVGYPRLYSWDFPCGSAGRESACNVGNLGSIPGLGRSPGEGKGYLFQYSGLENSMDCIVHRVTKSRTRLRDFHSHFALRQCHHLSATAAAAAKSLQSCPTLCDPIDSSPPGSAIPGILQARTLEWVAISFSTA